MKHVSGMNQSIDSPRYYRFLANNKRMVCSSLSFTVQLILMCVSLFSVALALPLERSHFFLHECCFFFLGKSETVPLWDVAGSP